jgi:hypothetical protein
LVVSVAALSVWLAVAGFLVKWLRAWSAGRLEPGVGSSWSGLYGMFAVAVVALGAGLFLTIRAWLGKSTVKWQVFSIVLAVISLLLVCGD